MKKFTVYILVCSLFFMLAWAPGAYTQPDDSDTHNTETNARDAEESVFSTKTGKSVTGCAAGAVAGTILFPAVGTVVGCATGVIAGWFWWK